MLSTVIILFSSVSTCIFSLEGPAEIPHAEMQGWMDMSSDTLYLKHKSGEPLNINEMEIVLTVNDQRHVFSSGYIYSNLTAYDKCWEIGEQVTIDIGEECGISVKEGDCIDLYLIHVPSKKMIQKMSVTIIGASINGTG